MVSTDDSSQTGYLRAVDGHRHPTAIRFEASFLVNCLGLKPRALESERDFRGNEVQGVGVDDRFEFAVRRKPQFVDVATDGGLISRKRVELSDFDLMRSY